MKTQRAQGATSMSPPCRRKSRFSLRGRKKKDGIIKGKLRIRSIPGAFLVLGIIVVVVGTALAVAGYWPYRISRSSILGSAEESVSESQTSGWTLGAKNLLSTASLIHSERMKLLGPVIMGVGLFILICANTVLYENRDRETQMLVAQMHSVICSVSAAVPSADLKDIAAANSMAKHYQWVSSLPATHLNILCVQQLASSEPLLQTRHPRDQEDGVEGIYRQAVLRHQESEPPTSLHSSHSNTCNSSQTHFNTQSGADCLAQSLLQHHCVNCLVSASSMSTLDEVDTPAVQPRRCHSMSYRTNPFKSQGGLQDRLHTPREEAENTATRKAAEDQFEDQPCQSWPRLNLISGRRYLKLENKEDSVDKLLDQLEQQCYQCDKSFGSGPFQ